MNISPRSIFCILEKAESKWWDKLLKGDAKTPHYVKVDWDKWVDEDDDPAPTDAGMDGMDFLKFGDMGGMPGMGGICGMPLCLAWVTSLWVMTSMKVMRKVKRGQSPRRQM